MRTNRRGLGAVLGTMLTALVLAPGSTAYADDQEPAETTAETKAEPASERSLDISVKGQIYSETTDFGAGQDRQGTRTDIHFQRMRLTLTGMLDEKFGFKFQTCGACGTTKQGCARLRRHRAGRRRERSRHPHHRRLRDRQLQRGIQPEDRPHEDPADPREPRRLLRAAVARSLDVRLHRATAARPPSSAAISARSPGAAFGGDRAARTSPACSRAARA